MRFTLENIEDDKETYGTKEVPVIKATFRRDDGKRHIIYYRECNPGQFSETFEFEGKFYIISGVGSIGFSRRPSSSYLMRNSRIMTQILLQNHLTLREAQRS